MKTLYDLKQHFDAELHGALDEWYEKFREDTGQKGLDLFLAYLSQRHLVSQSVIMRLKGGQPAVVTEVEAVAAGFQEAASAVAQPTPAPKPRHTPLEIAPTLGVHEHAEIDQMWNDETAVPIDKGVGLFGLEAIPAIDRDSSSKTQPNATRPPIPHTLHGEESLGPDSSADFDDATHVTTPREDLRRTIQSFPDSKSPFSHTLNAEQSAESTYITSSQDSLSPSTQSNVSSEEPEAFLPTMEGGNLSDILKIDDKNFELVGELGRGAMGMVFLAHEKNLGRKVAFKQIKPDAATERELMMRFLREAQITAQLDHPAIIPVHALVKGFRGLPAYTMKVVEGITLDVLIRETREAFEQGQSPDETHSLNTRLDYFLKVCDAMSYAHSKGVLHRDLKPKNILVGRFGEAYIVDWGLARLMFSQEDDKDSIKLETMSDFQSVKTQVGQLMGTPQYMSPEQAQGQIFEMDARSDIYSLGVILYELVYLKKALEGEHLLDIVNRVVKGQLREIPEQSPYERVPRELATILRKATAFHKHDRYETAKQMADALRNCLRGDPQESSTNAHASTHSLPHINFKAPEDSLPPELPRKASPAGWIAFAISFLLLLAGGAGYWWQYQQWTQKTAQSTKVHDQSEKTLLARIHGTHQQAQRIDQFLFHIQGLVRELTGISRMALLSGKIDKRAQYFLHNKFKPPDLKPSKFYQDSVSLEWPVFKLAPQKDPRKLKATLARLSLLRDAQRSILMQGLPQELANLAPQAKRDLLILKGLPLLSSFIALEQGVISLYPGRSGYPDDYDPTTRPWFKELQKKQTLTWTAPYVSSQKIRAVLIACLAPFLDEKGEFLGVAGADIRLNYLADYLTSLNKQQSWLKEATLLDGTGRKLVETKSRLRHFEGSQIIHLPLQMPLHSDPKLVKVIQEGQYNGHFIRAGGKKGWELVTYTRIQTLGWYLVTISDWTF